MNEHKKPSRILAIESKNLKIILAIMIINFSYYEKLVLAFQIQWLRVVISVPLLSVITTACAFYWLCDWTPTRDVKWLTQPWFNRG